MSTRCQVKVIQNGVKGLAEENAMSLYHHCDGYPTYILPLLQKAYVLGRGPKDVWKTYLKTPNPFPAGGKSYAEAWRLGRAGKVASFLCAVDPGQFEPLMEHELSGWIEWYYVIHTANNGDGGIPRWDVEVYEVRGDNQPEIKSRLDDFGNITKKELGKIAQKLEE